MFWLCPWYAEVPKPGIKPAPQQWQCQILNLLSHEGSPVASFFMASPAYLFFHVNFSAWYFWTLYQVYWLIWEELVISSSETSRVELSSCHSLSFNSVNFFFYLNLVYFSLFISRLFLFFLSFFFFIFFLLHFFFF